MLIQDAIVNIRGIDDDKEIIDFAARNFEKKKREEFIIGGRGDRITDLKEWSRIVLLTNRGWAGLPLHDDAY